MPLEHYQQKRDFRRTPEPRGAAAEAGLLPFRRFVMGRHRATRLHYDFRLEVDGVLASWALPRGPSMEPLAKRRAVRTEDHPLEYLDFEGVIPAGEYGGGDAIVWDHGTWDPELEEDPAASIEGGELKLVLHGERLHGRFALVRTGVERGREDWLLIRKREDAIEGWAVDDYPTSVLSGRTNEEVAAGVEAEIPPMRGLADISLVAARPASGAPDFVALMLATAVEGPFSDPDWLFELKLDGYRVQAVVNDGRVRLWTRRRVDAATYFGDFAATRPDWIGASEAIVDGEMVALDADGRPDFGLLQELAGMRGLGVKRRERRPASPDAPEGVAREATLVYHAFDLLRLGAWDLTPLPLEQRKRLLRLVLREHPSVRYVSHVGEHGEDFQAAVVRQGLEGSMAKLRSSPYEPGVRSRTWLKVKARREQELIVIGYEPGRGRARELGSVLVATRDGDAWRFAGHVGSGLSEPARRRLKASVDEAPLDAPVASDTPASATVRYGEPRTVIRAEFSEWTSDGLLRQAVFKGFEPDRDPTSVVREVPGPVPTGSAGAGARDDAGVEPGVDGATAQELAALDALGKGGRWQVGGHTLALTNLDKVLFPEAGYTKRDLIRYYTSIAPVILPYLRGRPLNVHRWPDGVGGARQFWQKQIPAHAPEWIARWDHPEARRGRSQTYVVADQVATMAWLANQACIDLHPWTSRTTDHWRPTYAYIDIDPGTDTTWDELLALARLYRTALEHLGVSGYPKVTGKRGIQIWIPVVQRYSFDETRAWVEALSRGVGAVVPELVSWQWSKAERGGRARLDYTQNSPIKTLVAPYAVRPVPSGAVSAPITWDELDDPELGPQRWNLRTVLDRVAERGDLFAGVLSDPQELPSIA